ncbi:MAG: hypothetical protein ACTSUE_23245 [Promethearchaeota archaeon]
MPFETYTLHGGIRSHLKTLEDSLDKKYVLDVKSNMFGEKMRSSRVELCYPSKNDKSNMWYSRGQIRLRAMRPRNGEEFTRVYISLNHVNAFWLVVLTVATAFLFLIAWVPKVEELVNFTKQVRQVMEGTAIQPSPVLPEGETVLEPSNEQAPDPATVPVFQQETHYCPYCGHPVAGTAGIDRITCDGCGSEI